MSFSLYIDDFIRLKLQSDEILGKYTAHQQGVMDEILREMNDLLKSMNLEARCQDGEE
jgi:hypothetical protein